MDGSSDRILVLEVDVLNLNVLNTNKYNLLNYQFKDVYRIAYKKLS